MKSFFVHRYVELFARPSFFRLNRALLLLALRGLGVRNFENDRLSGERYLVTKLLPKLIGGRDATLVDVGANVGDFTALLRSAFPAARIHAFEPHPSNHEQLSARMRDADRVTCHRAALGAEPGTVPLYDRADLAGSTHASLYRDVISELHRQDPVRVDVPIETLDAVAERERLERIDFLKIDTEGSELEVLKGAQRLLREGRIGYIQFEFNEMNLASRVFLRDFRALLGDHELLRLLPNGLLPLGSAPLDTELFAYQNIVAAPKRQRGERAV